MAWRAADYILDGRYCDVEAIVDEVEGIREAYAAEAALLIAFRKETLFHSLLRIVHRDEAEAELYQEMLVRETYKSHDDTLPFLASNGSPIPIARLMESLSHEPPFDSLAPLMKKRAVRLVHASESRGNSNPSHGASVFVLCFDPQREPPEVRSEQLIDSLALMVNASAPAVLHRDLEPARELDEVVAQVEQEIMPPTEVMLRDNTADDEESIRQIGLAPDVGDEDPRREMHSHLQRLLDEALRLTHSSVGNIYLATRDAQSLTLVAATRNDNPKDEIDPNDQDSVVAWVYRTAKPQLINDVSDFDRMHPDAGFVSVAGDKDRQPYAELAVPISQAIFGSKQHALFGVINVEKLEGVDVGHYTYADLTHLRNVAQRLCTWRAQGLLSLSGESLASLTRRYALPLREDPSDAKAHEIPSGIPAEFVDARKRIAEIVRRVYQLTRSQSVTVRLMTVDQKSLVRFAAHPPDRMHDRKPSLEIVSDEGINAWVLRNGCECYIPNLRHGEAFADFQDLRSDVRVRSTVAELCLPIFVNGRAVGTLNVESGHKDDYAETRGVVRAVAEQVGLSLDRARRIHEQVVISLSTRRIANVHELMKHRDALRKASGSASIDQIADGIEKCLSEGRDGYPNEPAPTWEILDSAAKQRNVTKYIRWRGRKPADVWHSEEHTLNLRVAFLELLRNAHAAAVTAVSRPLVITLGATSREHGGVRYLVLFIGNPTEEQLPEDLAERLYRVPLRLEEDISNSRSGRLHIGAFLAGTCLRSIGGDIYVVSNAENRFNVAVEIPMKDSGGMPVGKGAGNGVV
jgi:GAF domain